MTTNPFDGKQGGKFPEIIREMNVEGDSLVERVLLTYCRLELSDSFGDQRKTILQSKFDILSPAQIDLLVQELIKYEQIALEASTGVLISKLIQDSYDAGYNDFVLTSNDTPLNYLGCGLKGGQERKLQLKVKGPVGKSCGFESQYTTFIIEGDTGNNCGNNSKWNTFILGNVGDWCGAYSQHNKVIITGSAGKGCGVGAKHCSFRVGKDADDLGGAYSTKSSFIFEKNVGNLCAYLTHESSFTLEGTVGPKCGQHAAHDKFFTSNPETYKRLKRVIPKTNEVIPKWI